MNLENVTVEMRPRTEWEAVDLGARMVRRDAAAIYRIWFSITLPMLFLAMLLIFYSPYAAIAPLLYWWFEPLADGPILRIISRRLFGEDADVRAALRAAPRLAWQNKIFLFTPYRFHFARSIAMPLTQLEGLKGAARRARAKVLNLRILNHGTGVTVAYQHLALALYMGVILIGFVLVPAGYQDTIGTDWLGVFWGENDRAASALGLIVVYIAQTSLQPWFVGAGFGLYINCRTQLEAWDIEVAFRRMLQRRESGLAAALILAILAMPAVLMCETAVAQESTPSYPDETSTGDPGFSGYWSEEESRAAITSVIADERLKTTSEFTEWQALDQDEPEPIDDAGALGWWVALIEGFVGLISFIVEFGLWLAVAFLLGLIIATHKRWLPYLGMAKKPKRAGKRITLASGRVSAEQLPDDIPGDVARLWRNGERRKALSLLYRGSVFAAVTRHGVRLPPSATEGACVSAIDQQTDSAQADYFRKVVSVWMQCAYGFRDPDEAAVLPLCSEWPKHYGNTP